jgi:hypothetical protein
MTQKKAIRAIRRFWNSKLYSGVSFPVGEVLIVGDSVAQYTDSPIVCVTRHPSGLLQI